MPGFADLGRCWMNPKLDEPPDLNPRTWGIYTILFPALLPIQAFFLNVFEAHFGAQQFHVNQPDT